MHVASLIELSAPPNISSLTGSRGSERVLEAINANSGGAMYFGSTQDPYANHYRSLKNMYIEKMNVHQELKQSSYYVYGMNEIVPITNESELVIVPPVMQIPILTYEPIRHYYNNEMIEGWGIELPEEVEDTTGRLISNGLLEPSFNEDGEWTMPDELVWDYQFGDPDYTEEEIDALDETRRFFAYFIHSEIDKGDRRDPTGSDGLGTIGKLK